MKCGPELSLAQPPSPSSISARVQSWGDRAGSNPVAPTITGEPLGLGRLPITRAPIVDSNQRPRGRRAALRGNAP